MAGLARTYKPDAEVNDHVSLGQKIVFTISSACQSLRHDCVDALLHKLPLHDNNILLSAHMPCSCAVPFAEHFFWRRFHALFMHLCAVPLAEHFFWRRSHALFMHSCAVPFAEHFFWRRRAFLLAPLSCPVYAFMRCALCRAFLLAPLSCPVHAFMRRALCRAFLLAPTTCRPTSPALMSTLEGEAHTSCVCACVCVRVEIWVWVGELKAIST
jgi:hypothetical protein